MGRVFVAAVLCQLLCFIPACSNARRGCTAPFSLPNIPYIVVWNVPSQTCELHFNTTLNLTAWGIVENKGDLFVGNDMALLYNFGDFPRYAAHNVSLPINGGIPQEGNLSEHIRKVMSDISTKIPDPNFDGFAVIDFESWRPYLLMNFGSLLIYQAESKKLVMKQHPTWTNQTQITEEAIRQFDIAARLYIQGTLEVGRQMRPKAYWGYYGYPRCWGPSSTGACPKASEDVNDKFTGWMFASSGGLYPRIYTDRHAPWSGRHLGVQTLVHEALRVQVKWTGLEAAVMPYTLTQNGDTGFFNKTDLQIAIQEPADMGASGVVIWGSSAMFHNPKECKLLQDDINNVLGPFVKNLTQFTQACSQYLCNSHGRCISKEYETLTQKYLIMYEKQLCRRPRHEYENLSSRRQFQFAEKYVNLKKYDNYVCRCLAGWSGEFCNKRV